MFSNASGLGVNNYYGPRDTGGSVGSEATENSTRLYSINITSAMLSGTYLPPVTLPKGAQIKRVMLRVDEAFTITGTNSAVWFGATGSVTTNGIKLTATELNSVHTIVPTSDGEGTWDVASFTTAAAVIAMATASDTTFAMTTTAGRATLVFEVFNKTKI